MDAALEEVLELWRGKDAHVDEGHPLRREEFTLRRGSGGVRSAIFPWAHRDSSTAVCPSTYPSSDKPRRSACSRSWMSNCTR